MNPLNHAFVVGVVYQLVVIAEGADDAQQFLVVSLAAGGDIYCLTLHVLAVFGAAGFLSVSGRSKRTVFCW